MEKTGSGKLAGPFQIYHTTKGRLSSGYLLRCLMGMVATRRMLERVFIIQLSNTSNGSSLININQIPSHELRLPNVQQLSGDCDSFQLWAHYSSLFSQRVCGVTRLRGHHAIATATTAPELLRWKATPPPLCPLALNRRMALPLNVCQAQHGS